MWRRNLCTLILGIWVLIPNLRKSLVNMLFHLINLVKTTRMTQMWPSKPPLLFQCIFYRNYLVIGIRRSFLKGELYRNVKSVLIHDLGGQKLFKLSRACLGDFCPPISWFKKTEKTKLKSKREQKKNQLLSVILTR